MTNRLSVFSNADPSMVVISPFPYLIVRNCLDEDIYNELESSYPSDDLICDLDSDRRPKAYNRENFRVDILSKNALKNKNKLPKVWIDFIDYHSSKDFYSEVVNFFGPSINKIYPTLVDRNCDLNDLSCGRRFCEETDKFDLSLDCQVGINTPSKNKSSVLTAHIDSPEELYAGLLYFKQKDDLASGGDLELYKWNNLRKRKFEKHLAQNKLVEVFAKQKYEANTFIMFLNTLDSIHGVTPREPSLKSRRLVNIIGEVYNLKPEGLFVRPQTFRSKIINSFDNSKVKIKSYIKSKVIKYKKILIKSLRN